MSDEKLFATFERFELALTLDDARYGSQQGRCDEYIADLRLAPYVKVQLDALEPAHVRAELEEYGAWDDAELADHDANLDRILWIACGMIQEESNTRPPCPCGESDCDEDYYLGAPR